MVEEQKGAEKIAKWKEKEVSAILNNISKYKTIAVVNMQNLPSKQLRSIRSKLKELALIRMTRKRIIKKAIEASGNEKLKELNSKLKGMPALLFSNANAFELFKILKQNRTNAPAKAGQIAPNNIYVSAGPTPFSPGPIIGELGSVGIKAAIESGKVVIKEDSLVVKEGDKINELTANILSRLEIEPMQIGIDLISAIHENQIYEKAILDIDEEKFLSDLQSAHLDSFKLAVSLGIVNSDTATYLIQKAFTESLALAKSQDILTSETVKHIISKAEAQAHILNKEVKKHVPVEPSTKEETPTEPAKESKVPTKEKPAENENASAQEEKVKKEKDNAQNQ